MMKAVVEEARAIAEADDERVQYGFEEVRHSRTGRLLFELDAERLLIRVVDRKRVLGIVNLGDYGLAFVGSDAAMDRGFA